LKILLKLNNPFVEKSELNLRENQENSSPNSYWAESAKYVSKDVFNSR
jgi:hypothetical protein